MVSFGETKLGKIGETISEKWLKTAVFGQKRAFKAVFQNSDLPLTPSFVADAIAPSANNRYSVPYESRTSHYRLS